MARSFLSTGKAARFTQQEGDRILSDRAYNMTIGIVVAYGLIVNWIMCTFLHDQIMNWFTANPIGVIVGYIVCLLLGVFLVAKSRVPLVSFIGYSLVVLPLGVILTPIVEQYNAAIVFQAFGMTASVTVIMLCLGALFPDFFLRIGRVLFFSLLALCAVGFITLIFHMNIGFYSYASAAIFSMYIGYDWAKSNQYVHTLDNAIDSACDIYLDIINLFMDILAILGNGSSKK